MDLEQLVEAVTKVIMERLKHADAPKVAAFGDLPDGLLCPGAEVKQATACSDAEGCDYIVMSMEQFRSIHGRGSTATPAAPQPVATAGKSIDLTGKRLIHERDLRDHNTQNGDVVQVAKNAIITALAHDYAKSIGAKIIKG